MGQSQAGRITIPKQRSDTAATQPQRQRPPPDSESAACSTRRNRPPDALSDRRPTSTAAQNRQQRATSSAAPSSPPASSRPEPFPLYRDLLSHLFGMLSFGELVMADRVCKDWSLTLRRRSNIGSTFTAKQGKWKQFFALTIRPSSLLRHIGHVKGGVVYSPMVEKLESRLPDVHSLELTRLMPCGPEPSFAFPMSLRSLALRLCGNEDEPVVPNMSGIGIQQLTRSACQQLIIAISALAQLEDLRITLDCDYHDTLQLTPLADLTRCHTLYFSWSTSDVRQLSDGQIDAILTMPALRRLMLFCGDLTSTEKASVSAGLLPRAAASPQGQRLQSIGLDGYPLTPLDYDAFRQLPGLTGLEGDVSRDTALGWLPSLRSLVTLHTVFPHADAGIYAQTLAKLPQLKELRIRHEHIQDEHVLLIVRALPQLTSLVLDHMRALRSLGFLHHAASRARLTTLRICHCPALLSDAAGFLPLPRLPELRTLDLTGSVTTSVSEDLLQRYRRHAGREILPKLAYFFCTRGT